MRILRLQGIDGCLAPGFTTLWGLSEFSPTLRAWLDAAASAQPTVGGFLFVNAASVAIGVAVSAVRWAVVDSVHHATGIMPPELDFSKLPERLAGYTVLIEIHYGYYQFYSEHARGHCSVGVKPKTSTKPPAGD